MDNKKIIIGGLALVGGIALFSYLRKPKKNSEEFANASGFFAPRMPPMPPKLPTNIFGNVTLPKAQSDVCNLPDTFVRMTMTRVDGMGKEYCARYDRILTMTPKGKGFVYRMQPDIPSQTFVNGNFVNSSGKIIVTNPPRIIESSQFEYAFLHYPLCTTEPPIQVQLKK
jgi:hypothetical protein